MENSPFLPAKLQKLDLAFVLLSSFDLKLDAEMGPPPIGPEILLVSNLCAACAAMSSRALVSGVVGLIVSLLDLEVPYPDRPSSPPTGSDPWLANR